MTGVEFTSNGNVTLNVDTGPFSIIATDANGIFASSNGGFVTITSTADITTFGSGSTGIQGSVQSGALTITSSGRIVDQRQQRLRHRCGQRLWAGNRHLDR